MSIDISPEHEDFVRAELASGHFASEQELVNEAIELLRLRRGVVARLKNGLDQLARGEGLEYGADDRERFLADILGRDKL